MRFRAQFQSDLCDEYIAKNNFGEPADKESAGDSMVDITGYRDIETQLKAFMDAGVNLEAMRARMSKQVPDNDTEVSAYGVMDKADAMSCWHHAKRLALEKAAEEAASGISSLDTKMPDDTTPPDGVSDKIEEVQE